MDDKIEELDRKLLRKGKIVLVIGSILVFLSPILFTIDFGLLDFTHTGEIGDTIGGLTSPIIGLIGAGLVFLSFREQWLANLIQVDTIDKNNKEQLKTERTQLLWKLYIEIKNDLMNPKISMYNELMIKNRSLSKNECENYYYNLSPIMSNLYLLLTVLKGMDEGRISKDYAAIFLTKFEFLIGSIEAFKNVANSSELVELRFNKQLNELKKLQLELRELKWE